jgi:2-polyprenyl-3-methyl-5-hydroxy-6-metoxy-1,4-benzoquinol methylase
VNLITQNLRDHYCKTFIKHGLSPEGVDWGPNPADHLLRLNRMLEIFAQDFTSSKERRSILDVGCGYGSMLDLIKDLKLPLDYTGIDVCIEMIDAAKKRYPNSTWLTGDVLELNSMLKHDYVVCNGVLTQKLQVSIRDMDDYLRVVIKKLFELCRIGIAFNVMTTHVNYMESNLFYKNPIELLGWCMTELTSKVRLDHAYPLYEYTIYLYHEDRPRYPNES